MPVLQDFITRFGIRSLLRARLDEEKMADGTAQQQRVMKFVDELKSKGIAEKTTEANIQVQHCAASELLGVCDCSRSLMILSLCPFDDRSTTQCRPSSTRW